MPGPVRVAARTAGWKPIPNPEGRYSTGIADFDRLLGGGFARGSMALLALDETVGPEDLDLLLFPTFLNFLYQSRGVIAVLPSRDSPHGFRTRLTRFVTRRRFDSRVRVVDYVGEDEGLSYVVNIRSRAMTDADGPHPPKEKKAALAKMVAAEKAVAGSRNRPFLEYYALEVMETLMGPEAAAKMFFHGVKRSRQIGNVLLAPMAPGLGSTAAARRMADTEFALHRDDVGLMIRGIRPGFPNHVLVPDTNGAVPRVVFVPRPV